VGELVLADPDFRLFLVDLTTVARHILRDTANAVSGVAGETGEKLAPSGDAARQLRSPSDQPATPDGLGSQVAEVAHALEEGSSKVIDEARQSVADNLSGQEKATLLSRLKKSVSRLRERPDYRSSVDSLADFIKRVAAEYSRVLQTSATALQENIGGDDALESVVRNSRSLLKRFGDPALWKELERRIQTVLEHKRDADLEELLSDAERSLETLLTDPSSWDTVEERFAQARANFNSVAGDSSLREDVDALFDVLKRTAKSVLDDQDVKRVIEHFTRMMNILSPPGEFVDSNLIEDVLLFVPALIKTIQTIPIPRLEISTPQIDLLLETILLTPGRTLNKTFLPLHFKVSTTNALTVHTTRTNSTASSTSSQTTISLSGLSLAATDAPFLLHSHFGPLHFTDAGLLSLALDRHGFDLSLTFSLHRNSPTHIITLDRVRAQAPGLTFSLRSSTFSLVAWLLRPLVKPILKRALRSRVEQQVREAVRALDRELVFARERLRAARASGAVDPWAFWRAVAARWDGGQQDEPDRAVRVRVGVDAPAEGPFAGVYAPGSVVGAWRAEAEGTEGWAERGATGGWRNTVFDL
jgi:hypothetical protein